MFVKHDILEIHWKYQSGFVFLVVGQSVFVFVKILFSAGLKTNKRGSQSGSKIGCLYFCNCICISTASKKERIGFPANKSNMCEGRSDGGNGEPCSGNLGL